MSVAVEFRNVDIVFGAARDAALAMIDKGVSRAEILEKTGAVLGCAGANLTVHEGEISVLMGLSVWAGHVLAAMNVSTHAGRVPASELEKRFLPIMLSASRELSSQLFRP